ncbi:MAG TPA: hypothetical protein VGF14_02630 [Alphaproteobacteria bacterium]
MVYHFSFTEEQEKKPDMHEDAVADIIRDNEITPLYLTYRADYKAQTSKQGYAIGNLSTLFPREVTKPTTLNNVTQLLLRNWVMYDKKPAKFENMEPHQALAALFDMPRFTPNHILAMAYDPKAAVTMRLARKMDIRFGMGSLMQKVVKRNRKYGEPTGRVIDLPFQSKAKDYEGQTHGALLYQLYQEHRLTSQELARLLKTDSTKSPKMLSYIIAQHKNPEKYGLNNPAPTLDAYYAYQIDKHIFGLENGPFGKIFDREKLLGEEKSNIVSLRYQSRQAKVHCPEFFSYEPYQLGKIRKYQDLANNRDAFYEAIADFSNYRVNNPLELSHGGHLSLQVCMGWGPPTSSDIANAHMVAGLKNMEPDQQEKAMSFFRSAIQPVKFDKFRPKKNYKSIPQLYKSHSLWSDEDDNPKSFARGIEQHVFAYFLEQKKEFGLSTDEKILEKGDLRVFTKPSKDDNKLPVAQLYIHQRLIENWEDHGIIGVRSQRSRYEDVPY